MVILRWLLIVSGLALTGCAGLSGFIDTSISAAKAANDKIATTLIQANCGMSVGAYWRVLNKQKRLAVDVLCGGDGSIPDANTILIVPSGSVGRVGPSVLDMTR